MASTEQFQQRTRGGVGYREAGHQHERVDRRVEAVQNPTEARAGGFAFVTTVGRLVGAGLTFAIGAMNDAIGLGKSLSLTAIFFVIGLLLLPLAREGKRALAPE